MQGMLKESFEDNIRSNGNSIIEESDPRYKHIESILSRLIDACVYFSPESEKYFRSIKLVVVNTKEVNACASFGNELNITLMFRRNCVGLYWYNRPFRENEKNE